MQNIENKTVLITGGSKGIGYGIAEVLLREKMKVAITSRSQKAVDEAVAKLRAVGSGDVMGIVTDVRDLAARPRPSAQGHA